MNNAISEALKSLYSLHREYDDFASKAPLHYDAKTEAEIDKFDTAFDELEEQVFALAQMIKDEDEAYVVLSLMHQWYRIPRYLERHAA